jgi:hypothetical protein
MGKQVHPNNKGSILYVAVLSMTTVFLLFIWQGQISFSLSDEGYLWYGVQRVMQGEIPSRDFMAYDPGRYYLSAALMHAWGDDGIVPLRATLAIFQAIGLFVGLSLIARSVKKQSLIYLFASSIILTVWMYPHFKVFDTLASILLIWALALLAKKPTSSDYFIVGLSIGLIAVLGRNHGFYGVLGSLGLMLWMSIRRNEPVSFTRGALFWASGIIVGYMPMLVMMLFIPEFFEVFFEGLKFMLVEAKATNIALPIPWPWQVNFTSTPVFLIIQGVLLGLFFIAIVAVGALSLCWVCWQKYQKRPVLPVLVSASFLALPYAHYAYSRADAAHLALGIFPLLIGFLVLLAEQSTRVKFHLATILCVASLWTMMFYQPGWQCQYNEQCVKIDISGSDILVPPNVADDIDLLRKLETQYAQNNQSFIATPFWPGAYAVLDRKSPMWETYALFPRGPNFEQAEISRIEKSEPGFVVVLNRALDGRDDLRFPNTHPLTYQYIVERFERLPDWSNSKYQIFRKQMDVTEK